MNEAEMKPGAADARAVEPEIRGVSHKGAGWKRRAVLRRCAGK